MRLILSYTRSSSLSPQNKTLPRQASQLSGSICILTVADYICAFNKGTRHQIEYRVHGKLSNKFNLEQSTITATYYPIGDSTEGFMSPSGNMLPKWLEPNTSALLLFL